MEVNLLSKTGIDDDAVLSISDDSVRMFLQAQINSGRPSRFAEGIMEESSLRIEILKQVGSADLVMKPGEDRYNVCFSEDGKMHLELELKKANPTLLGAKDAYSNLNSKLIERLEVSEAKLKDREARIASLEEESKEAKAQVKVLETQLQQAVASHTDRAAELQLRISAYSALLEKSEAICLSGMGLSDAAVLFSRWKELLQPQATEAAAPADPAAKANTETPAAEATETPAAPAEEAKTETMKETPAAEVDA